MVASQRRIWAAIFMLTMVVMTESAWAVQLQSLIRIKGEEENKLIGMGLVVGLNGTGDGGKFMPAVRPLAKMMNRLMDPNIVASELKDVTNVAVVTVTAKIPASGVREGDKVDVQIASVGPASSLKGGRLFMTPMQGPVPNSRSPIFGFAEGGVELPDKESPTVGVVKGGAVITRNILTNVVDEFGRLTLVIDNPNATWPMANTIATLVNDVMAPDLPPIATAIDRKNIVIELSRRDQLKPGPFIQQLLEIQLDASLVRTEARVVINQRSGTIVMTGDVEISPVVISHKGLTITTITPVRKPTIDAPKLETTSFVAVDSTKRAGTRMADLLAAFNQLKVPSEDRIAIIKEIHRSGKLHAKLIMED